MPATQEQLDAAMRDAAKAASRRLPKKAMRDGSRVVRSVPFACYANAVKTHGVDPGDEEYWEDMERLHPEIVVKTEGKPRWCLAGRGPRRADGKVRTRFGWATRKRYG